ncbi:MAG: hypothetical protein ACLPYS_12330 [Vulcanimicrobiaceae bacterium]
MRDDRFDALREADTDRFKNGARTSPSNPDFGGLMQLEVPQAGARQADLQQYLTAVRELGFPLTVNELERVMHAIETTDPALRGQLLARTIGTAGPINAVTTALVTQREDLSDELEAASPAQEIDNGLQASEDSYSRSPGKDGGRAPHEPSAEPPGVAQPDHTNDSRQPGESEFAVQQRARFKQVRAAEKAGRPEATRKALFARKFEDITLPEQGASGETLLEYWRKANRAGVPVTAEDLELFDDNLRTTSGRNVLIRYRNNERFSEGMRRIGQAHIKQNPQDLKRFEEQDSIAEMITRDRRESVNPTGFTADLNYDAIAAGGQKLRRNMKRLTDLGALPKDPTAKQLAEYRTAARAVGVRLTINNIDEYNKRPGNESERRIPGESAPLGVQVLKDLELPARQRTLLTSDPKAWAKTLREQQPLAKTQPIQVHQLARNASRDSNTSQAYGYAPAFDRNVHAARADDGGHAPPLDRSARAASAENDYSRSPNKDKPSIESSGDHQSLQSSSEVRNPVRASQQAPETKEVAPRAELGAMKGFQHKLAGNLPTTGGTHLAFGRDNNAVETKAETKTAVLQQNELNSGLERAAQSGQSAQPRNGQKTPKLTLG